MAFQLEDFTRTGSAGKGGAFWVYTTEDSDEVVLTANYFNAVYSSLRAGDVITTSSYSHLFFIKVTSVEDRVVTHAAVTAQDNPSTARANEASEKAMEATSQALKATAKADSFDARYLGAKTLEPTVDNDGNSLLVGAMYYDTLSDSQLVWNGTSWKGFADYEQGTFTPYIGTWRGGVPTTDSRGVFLGSYTKVGRLVTCQINISSLWLTGTTSGILVIKGLPFTPAYLSSGTQFQSGALGAVTRLKFARKDNTAFSIISTVGVGIESTNNEGNYAWEKNSIVLGASIIRGSITYFTDA